MNLESLGPCISGMMTSSCLVPVVMPGVVNDNETTQKRVLGELLSNIVGKSCGCSRRRRPVHSETMHPEISKNKITVITEQAPLIA